MKVLISKGYGAGWSSWNTGVKGLATDPELVRLVEANEHRGDGKTRPTSDPDSGLSDASPAFVARAQELAGAGNHVCFLGVFDLVVETVSERFRIDEHDGFESIRLWSDEDWIDP